MQTTVDSEQVRAAVHEIYGRIAAEQPSSGCCGTPACCGLAAQPTSEALGYSEDERGSAPDGADLGLGCGNPQAIAELKAGERVLDLGSGAGFDAFLAARQVGDTGSIIVILATDAPLLPIQCQRLSRRATTGLAWTGGFGANTSGDLFLAFSTGNHVRHGATEHPVTMLAPEAMDPLFEAAAEATHEAILNALCMAETVTGFKGRTAHALPLDELVAAMKPVSSIGKKPLGTIT